MESVIASVSEGEREPRLADARIRRSGPRVVARVLQLEERILHERVGDAHVVLASQPDPAVVGLEAVRLRVEREVSERIAQREPLVAQPVRGVLKKCSVQPLKA